MLMLTATSVTNVSGSFSHTHIDGLGGDVKGGSINPAGIHQVYSLGIAYGPYPISVPWSMNARRFGAVTSHDLRP